MSGEAEHQGSWLCGAVCLKVKGADRFVDAYHCNICRKWGWRPLIAVECGSDVQFERDDQISTFSSSEWAERKFCRTCGTHLFYHPKETDVYMVPAWVLDIGVHRVFNRQVFIDEKPSFYSFANNTNNLTGAELLAQYAPSELKGNEGLYQAVPTLGVGRLCQVSGNNVSLRN